MKTMNSHRCIALGTLSVFSAAMIGGPLAMPVDASAKGRRNTAIGLGAVTAYGLLKGKKTLAIVGAVGTAYAYKRYRDAKKRGRYLTLNEAFRGQPVYDSQGRRYAASTRYVPGRTYYTARGGRR